MNNILRKFTHNFSFAHSSNFPGQYVQDFEFCVAGRMPDKQVFVSLETYQKVSGKKISALYKRVAKFVVSYLYIDGDLYVDEKSIKVWLKADKEPRNSAIGKLERQEKMKSELLECLWQPSIWFYGVENGLSEQEIQEMTDEDFLDSWRCEMAEIERFAMLGF